VALHALGDGWQSSVENRSFNVFPVKHEIEKPHE
jgi:hypothetical protein